MSKGRRDYEEVHQLVERLDPEEGHMWWKAGRIPGQRPGGGRWCIRLWGRETSAAVPNFDKSNAIDVMYMKDEEAGEFVYPYRLKPEAPWMLVDLFKR